MHELFHKRRYLIPFRGTLLPQIFCDTLVIGTGVAGLRAAIAAAEFGEVIVLAKGDVDESSTAWAQGGIAGTLEPGEVEAHVQDTFDAGAGLCDERVVREAISAAPERLRELIDWGVDFDLDDDGYFALTREGGHHQDRVWHCHGDETGRCIARVLTRRALEHAAIRVFDHCFALDLLTPPHATGSNPPVIGAVTHHPRYGLQMIWADAVILASGGAGQVYRETTNPAAITGDGMAMAWRAGAKLADMAMIQFHPTTLYVAGSERSLISEAVRGEGAFLVDRRGDRFMQGVHPMGELAPRDIVSRGIREHLLQSGQTHVFLDARHFDAGYFVRRFPTIHAKLSEFGINPETDLIPVHPSAHYTIGGVWVDSDCRTNLPNLYACGEAACTGLHGANRLASNSLLEGLVFGERAGRIAGEQVARSIQEFGNGERSRTSKKIISDIPLSRQGGLDLADVRSSLRSVMWRHLGVVRERAPMADVVEMIDFWARYTLDKIFDEPDGWETQNMLYVASLICDSAIWREESRGVHARTDFARQRDEFRVHDLRWRDGGSEVETVPATGPATTAAGRGGAAGGAITKRVLPATTTTPRRPAATPAED